MKRKILVILVITAIALAFVQQSMANSVIHGKFTAQYDVSGTKLDSCQLCMASTTAPVSWNEYGMELKSNSDFKDNLELAMKNIESMDSDGDGFTNIEEIQGATFPGDASDFPAMMPEETSTPEAMSTPEVTATIQQTPVMEETEPVSTSGVNAFATLVMFAAVFFLTRKKEE